MIETQHLTKRYGTTVAVHRSAGLLTPGPAIAVLGAYATIAMAAALIRVAHTDA
jgi:hypothetical protein